MFTLEFNRDYQRRLLGCLFHTPQLLDKLSRIMKPSDWSQSAARYVWCCLQDWRRTYGTVPTFAMLADYIETRLKSGAAVGGDEVMILEKPLHEALALLLGRLAQTTPAEAAADTPYITETVKDYLVHSRCSVANHDHQSGDDVRKLVDAQAQAISEIDAAFAAGVREGYRRVPVYDEIPHEPQDFVKAPVGVPVLDRALGGGLGRGTAGIIIAGTGIGKSNAGLHIATTTGYTGHGALYISLELSAKTIMCRGTAMAANVPARELFKPADDVGEQYRHAIAAVRRPDYRFRDSVRVVEITDHKPKVAEIEKQIVLWKQELADEGRPAEYPLVVFVDWLEYLDISEWQGRDRSSSNNAAAIEHAMRALRMMAVRQNIVIWTAMQANRAAVNRELVGMDMAAHSYGANTVSDLTLTLARKEIIIEGDTCMDWLSADDPVSCQDMGTSLHLMVAKCRGANLTGKVVKIYRDPSLRFWHDQGQSMRASKAISAGDWDTLVQISQEVVLNPFSRR